MAMQQQFNVEDQLFDPSLRPKEFEEFIGQSAIVERLKISIMAAKQRDEPLPHQILSGPPGLGKTTLAHLIAKERGSALLVTSGPSIEKAGDLAGLLTQLNRNDVLFIDEIHRLQRNLEEYLYSAMEDYFIDIVIDHGPQARSIQLRLAPFTLVGATTRLGLLSSPMRTRFSAPLRLEFYSSELLVTLLQRSARLLHFPIDQEALLPIAMRSRGTPRIANHLLRFARDFAQVHEMKRIDCNVIRSALNMLAIDEAGLDELDLKLLRVIQEDYQRGPCGLHSLAIALSEDKQTIEEVVEPYLIMQGFLQRTPRGRVITDKAIRHLETIALLKE